MRHPALLATGLAFVMGHAAEARSDFKEVKARGRLEVLVVPGSPEFFDHERKVGLDWEILAGFARLHRLELKTVLVKSWDLLLPHLNEGKGDLASGGVTVTPVRQKQANFTVDVFPTRGVVVTRKPNRVIRTLEDLRAETVGTIRGTNLVELVAGAGVPPARVDDSFASGGLPAALRAGKITATVLGVEDAIVAQRVDPELQLGVFVGPRQGLAYAVRKGDVGLLAALNEYISNLRRTPTWNRLVIAFFGNAAVEILQKAQTE